jgi:PIN like domain
VRPESGEYVSQVHEKTGEEQLPEDGLGAGLFDGFEGYRTPSEDDYRLVLKDGLVVPDTNVLLNLYRYTPQVRAEFLNVLKRLGDQLWIPHQVLLEFWRNRESALRDPQETASEIAEALEDQRERARDLLRRWANRAAIPDEQLTELQDKLDDSFSAASEAITSLPDPEAIRRARDTNEDQVLHRLEPILRGRMGGPLSPEELDVATAEGAKRIEAGLPPGYRNKTKGEDLAVGDYIVWVQILAEAERRHCDVLFVTGDVKDDWWRRERGEWRGPRLELVDELRDRTGTRLLMLRPDSLLKRAAETWDLNILDESFKDIARVDRVLGVGSSEGWSAQAVQELMRRLDQHGPVQAAAIRHAAGNKGFVTREDIYILGRYEDSRTLRGFTRPANRIAQELRSEGLVPESAVDVLEAVYDPRISYVQASGFRIPEELIPLLHDLS